MNVNKVCAKIELFGDPSYLPTYSRKLNELKLIFDHRSDTHTCSDWYSKFSHPQISQLFSLKVTIQIVFR